MISCCEKTLVYKRTHRGDPNAEGIFGIHDCMGKVRNWDFNAVIGVGGKSPDAGSKGIAHKINWIGKGAIRYKYTSQSDPSEKLYDIIKFDFFCLYDERGKSLKRKAPNLYEYMFENKHVRAVLSQNLSSEIQGEIAKILNDAEKCGCPKKIVQIDKEQGRIHQLCSGCCK